MNESFKMLKCTKNVNSTVGRVELVIKIFPGQTWAKYCRQIPKIKDHRFSYGMLSLLIFRNFVEHLSNFFTCDRLSNSLSIPIISGISLKCTNLLRCTGLSCLATWKRHSCIHLWMIII